MSRYEKDPFEHNTKTTTGVPRTCCEEGRTREFGADWEDRRKQRQRQTEKDILGKFERASGQQMENQYKIK